MSPTHSHTIKVSEGSLFKRVPLLASIATSGLSMGVNGLLAMAVSWALLSGGSSPVLAGIAAAALHLPVALGSAVGGLLSDRYGARPVLIASNLAALSAACLAAAAAVTGGPVAAVVVFLAVANGLGAPGTIAQDTRVPELARLSGTPLERANGWRDLVGNLGQVGGPAVGVLLVEVGGLAGACVAAAVLLAVIALIDALTFPRTRVLASRQTQDLGSRGGYALLRADPALWTVALLGVPTVAVFTALDEILAPSLALSSGRGADTLSLFLILMGVSALASGALFAFDGHRVGKRTVLLSGLALAAVGLSGLAVLPTAIAFVIPPLLLGFGIGPLWPLVVTIIHRRVPASDRGRVIGALVSTVLIAQPLASLAAGPAVALVGATALAAGLAAVACAVAVTAPFLPGLRALD